MNQCQLEERNPYLKEWAIFVLRNVTELHSGNQDRIAQLKAQGVRRRVCFSVLRVVEEEEEEWL